MRRSLAVVAVVSLAPAGCGPSQTEVRRYVSHSPHRSLAVFPFDYGGGQRNAAPTATNSVIAKLREDGFSLADRNKTLSVYNASQLRAGSFGRVADAAQLALALGAKAAVVGIVDAAVDRVDKTAAVYDFQPVAPPSCCLAPHPCPHHAVYDPYFSQYVDMCSGTHRRVTVRPGFNGHVASLSLRLRVIDARDKSVLWQGGYSGTLHQTSFGMVSDEVSGVLNDQLIDALMKQGQ